MAFSRVPETIAYPIIIIMDITIAIVILTIMAIITSIVIAIIIFIMLRQICMNSFIKSIWNSIENELVRSEADLYEFIYSINKEFNRK